MGLCHSFNLSTVYHFMTESHLGFLNFRSLLEYCTEHINTFCWNIQIFSMSQHVVHRITTTLRRDKRLCKWFVSRLSGRLSLLFQAKMRTLLWIAVEHSNIDYIPKAFCAYLVDSILRFWWWQERIQIMYKISVKTGINSKTPLTVIS